MAFFIFSVIIIYGSFQIKFNYFIPSFHQNTTTKEKIIALTFDDGPTEFTPKFLELLHKNNTKATFFCIGKQIKKHPEIFRKTIEDGHEIGNHTFSHSEKIGFFSFGKMLKEIEKCDEIIEEFGTIKTELFRPPFGVTNPKIAKAIQKFDKKSIGWNIRSFDTVIDDSDKILAKIIPQIKPGSIILLHDTSEKTYKVLAELLLFLERENYKMVTVSQLLNLKK